ncbi:hypothetical protein BKA66DRAFT_428071 [Pyrenochaeta sp. MPI-SDFR-AT-0127]|nr:hypothetical protein BKA66DRAFT_428071 [Pyrenochaeta sp. MPI-SDFR-AT-0127]
MSTLPNATPVRAYINPFFTNQAQVGGQAQSQVDPNALASAMSFMSTPAGQQSMAAFANHMAGIGSAGPQQSQSSPPQHAQPAPRYSPPQHAGQKRKLNDHSDYAQSPSPRKLSQQGSKPPRAKATVAPPVPSFGFSLPSPVTQPSMTSKSKNKKTQEKRKVHLGLTHDSIPDEASGEEKEEDVDEEAAYAEKLKGGGFSFEHEGEQISIQTAAEVAAWIKDRRKRFPTRKRIMEKAEESATKRKSEIEFLRKLKGKPPNVQDVGEQVKHKPPEVPERSRDSKQNEENSKKKQEELAALRRKLHESMMQKQAAPSTVDLGLGYNSETESDEEGSVLSESSVVSSSEESDESEPESDESDQAPAPVSSKVGPQPITVPPPAPKPTLPRSEKGKERICRDWEQHGRCSYSNRCRFAHPPKEVKRVGLYGMMVEQELVKRDQLALDAIKYLGQHGFLG